MALLTSELQQIKAELGFHLVNVTAEPYIGVTALFEQIIQPYIQGGAITSSSTTLAAASSPTSQSLVVGSSTGFNAGDMMIVDVDSQQERATIQSISGNTVQAILSLAHSGTYPVTIEGGEARVRAILRELNQLTFGLNGKAGTLASLRSRVGIKKADDVEFFGGGSTLASQGIDNLAQVQKLREFWRDELAYTLGISRLNGGNTSGGSSMSVY